MFSKTQFIDSVQLEANICKHLHSKTSAEDLSYRPTPNQRSMLELLQYLTTCGKTPVRGLVSNDWSHLQDELLKTAQITYEGFCEAMGRQTQEVKKLLIDIPESDFSEKTVTLPNMQEVILGAALVNFPLKFLAAYRMQLFLYLKSTGTEELTTMNCWFGMDGELDDPEERER